MSFPRRWESRKMEKFMIEVKKVELSAKAKKDIDHWTKKFPDNHKQSALLAALHIVQDENNGHLTEALMAALADYLEISKIAVLEVASFYFMYDLKPTGKNKLYVCTNIACQLRGADEIMNHIKKRLNINKGETTKDGLFTLKEWECLGACTGAPMMQVNKDYHENLDTKKVDEILDDLK